MNTLLKTPFDDTSDVYNCSANATLQWSSIKFSELHVFTRAVQVLINSLGKLDEGDYWFDFQRRIRVFRFNLIACPLSENILQERLADLLAYLQETRSTFLQSRPDAADQYENLMLAGKRLQPIKTSHLLMTLTGEIREIKDTGSALVLVCEPRFIVDAETSLQSSGIRNIDVASPSYLKSDVSYENMFIIGPTRWFPSFVFSAPRANKIRLLKFAWISDSWKHQTVFVNPLKQKPSRLMQITNEESPDISEMDADSLLPPAFNFKFTQNQVVAAGSGHNDIDYLQARLFLLEDDWVVPLSAEDDASILVINLADTNLPVRKMKVAEIEPGIFVLIRTTGGGDFIIPVADQILGPLSEKARKCQREWKSLLRNKIVENGYDWTIKQLKTNGSPRANYMNVRNWMFDRSIKTEFREDFHAIMKLIGLEEESDANWNLMSMIDRAHRQAGRKIRSMLIDKVKNSDLRAIKKSGKIDFELEQESEISITAFQVREISSDIIKLPHWQIGNPIKQA